MPADARTLVMSPPTGERLVRFVGDRIRFELHRTDGTAPPDGWRAWLRTNLGRGPALQRELIHSRVPTTRIHAQALAEGLVPLVADGMGRAYAGATTLAEVLRVAG